jgi:hypothetical protein
MVKGDHIMAQKLDWSMTPEGPTADAFAEAAASNLGLPYLLMVRALNLAFNGSEDDAIADTVNRTVTRGEILTALETVARRFTDDEYTGY